MTGLRRGLATGDRGFPSTVKKNPNVVLGSVFGPLLFIIYINDIDRAIISDIGKTADDTIRGRTVRTGEDAKALQEDPNKLSVWSDKWQISFYITKCKVQSVVTRNPYITRI